jgi:hypothetical protein
LSVALIVLGIGVLLVAGVEEPGESIAELFIRFAILYFMATAIMDGRRWIRSGQEPDPIRMFLTGEGGIGRVPTEQSAVPDARPETTPSAYAASKGGPMKIGPVHETTTRWLTVVYCLLVAIICLYVPWRRSVRGMEFPLGYSFLWRPPDELAAVDWGRVVLELVAVTAVIVAGRFLLYRRFKP